MRFPEFLLTAPRCTIRFVWLAFLFYCPTVILVSATFGWAFPYFSSDDFTSSGLQIWFEISVLASWVCALITTLFHLFRPRKMILPAAILLAPLVMIMLSGPLKDAALALYIWPEASFVKKHCAPIKFVQDGRSYKFGVCDMKMDSTGQIADFSFVYDTSGDIGKFGQLSKNDEIAFIDVVRQFFRDDPNEQFENADFTASSYGSDFYAISFQDANAEGFVKIVGVPPANRNNPYPPMFW